MSDKVKVLDAGEEKFLEREYIKELLQSEEYGYLPPEPKSWEVEFIEDAPRFCAGKAVLNRYVFKATMPNGEKTEFPFYHCYPRHSETKLTVVSLNFRPEVPNKYLPAEELIDNGLGFIAIDYQSVTSDDTNMEDKVSGVLQKYVKKRTGKIMIWAWSAMRAMDYLQTLDFVDKNKIFVSGHSRLGKTALVVGAFDTRFAGVFANNSGTGGSGLYKEWIEGAETLRALTTTFSEWFCDRLAEHSDKGEDLPFDQNFLHSLIAPRYLLVTSSENDLWSNQESEFRCCRYASVAWENLGAEGLIAPKTYEMGELYADGKIGYRIRKGEHYFSREDWHTFIRFMKKKGFIEE